MKDREVKDAAKLAQPVPAAPSPEVGTATARPPRSGAGLSPREVLALQRTVGNRAVCEMLGKGGQAAPPIQARMAEGPRQAPAAPSGVYATGIPVPVRTRMEAAFQSDFSHVRVFPGSARAETLGALAFTQGNDIHFAPRRWAPETPRGQELLGHELAHVMQQRAGRVHPTAHVSGAAVNDEPALEREADSLSASVARAAAGVPVMRAGGLPVTPPGPGAIQMAKDANDFKARFALTDVVNITPVGGSFDDPALAAPASVATASAPTASAPAASVPTASVPAASVPAASAATASATTPAAGSAAGAGEDAKHRAGGVAYLAVIPNTPGAITVKTIEDTYAGGFDRIEDLSARFGMSIGVNAGLRLGVPAAEAKQRLEAHHETRNKPARFPRAVALFTWERLWRAASGPVSNAAVQAEYAEMKPAEQEKARAYEREDEAKSIPYGAIRGTIMASPLTAKVAAALAARGNQRLFYHVGDDDAVSLRAPLLDAKESRGVYDAYDQLLSESDPRMVAGGYRVRSVDDEDRGDVPAAGGAEFLAGFASDVDQIIRGRLSAFDTRIPYLSETNILVSADAVSKSSVAPQNLFGTFRGESTALRQNILGDEMKNPDAAAVGGMLMFNELASLVTGTGGGGQRFRVNLRKRLEGDVTPEELALEYRKAISTGQNIGHPANWGTNVSLYFWNVYGAHFTAADAVTILLEQAAAVQAGGLGALLLAVLKRALQDHPAAPPRAPTNAKQAAPFVAKLAAATIGAHLELMENLMFLISAKAPKVTPQQAEEIQKARAAQQARKRVKRRKGSASASASASAAGGGDPDE